MLPRMGIGDEQSLDEWRMQRLKDAVRELAHDNWTEFGKRMGYADGSYMRQMKEGRRAITEKFIWKFEDVFSQKGWFERDASDTSGSLQQQIRTELHNREVPEHTLRAFLDTLRGYPLRRKTA